MLSELQDIDKSGTLDVHELELLAATAGKKMSRRQLTDAMKHMDADGSGEVDFEEFKDWWTHGVLQPPKGGTVFRQISEKMEAKAKNVRTLFRSFDENADGTVSQHEFRKGLDNLGINLTDTEFTELMETVDEDNSNEIDYNEFANSGIMGGKFFAARNPQGFSGCKTNAEVIVKRRNEYKDFTNKKVDSFWSSFRESPSLVIGNMVKVGGTGSF